MRSSAAAALLLGQGCPHRASSQTGLHRRQAVLDSAEMSQAEPVVVGVAVQDSSVSAGPAGSGVRPGLQPSSLP